MSYRLSPRAESDLETIADYIAERNPAAARRLVETFMERWALLATQPRSGASRQDIGEELRHIVTGRYIAFYRIAGEDVVILRVLHGARRITSDDIDIGT